MKPQYPAPDWFWESIDVNKGQTYRYQFVQHVGGWDCYYDPRLKDYFAICPEHDSGPITAPRYDVNEDSEHFNEPGFQEALAFCQAHYNLSQ